MKRISWTEHRTNNSTLEELEPACRFLAEVKRENYSTSVTWFELITSARTFYMASLPEKDAEEDHGDVGLTISSNGQEYPLQSVFSTQRTEARGEPCQ